MPCTVQRACRVLLHMSFTKLEIPDFGSGLKSQEPGAGKEFHRNSVLVREELQNIDSQSLDLWREAMGAYLND